MSSASTDGTAAVTGAPDPGIPGWERPGRAAYMLALLTLFYTSSFIDRAILNILAQPIKEDLGLADWQLGILGGLAFATFYATLGVPIARLAERRDRLTIISVALTVWSAMTVACAAAGNFLQLALARAGVGVGEAACTPCAHSLIADTVPAERRATAMAIYSLGIPLGTLGGTVAGAWVAAEFGWRWAFVAVGAPGLVLALLARLTLKEPPRGRFDPPAADQPPPLSQVLRHLLARRAFRHMAVGAAVCTMAGAGMSAFLAPFLLRGAFGLDLKGTALILGGLGGALSLTGIFAGGALSDRLGRGDVRRYLRLPGWGFLLGGPLHAAAFLQEGIAGFVALFSLGQLASLLYVGPTFGVLHNMVEARMRATAVAIVFVLTSLLGLGLGPVVVGAVSDLAGAALAGPQVWEACEGATDPACRAVSFAGVRIGLLVTAVAYVWAGVHYLLAARTLKEDLVVRPAGAA